MRLAFEDVQTGAVYRVQEAGAVLGRERARTDIVFRDESISKRHARVFVQDGQWFLEDLDSSNGTYVRNERVFEPTMLREGIEFSLAQRRFRVVMVDGDDEVDTDRRLPPAPGSVFVAAATHYLIGLPKLAFVPVGFVREMIEGVAEPHPRRAEAPALQRSDARTAPELAVFGAFGGGIAAGWMPFFEAGLAFALEGRMAWPPSAWLVVAGAAAGGAAGALAHPTAEAAIRTLGGAGDARARSRLILTVFVAIALVGFPVSARAALAPLDPVLVTAVTSALGLWTLGVVSFAAFRWGRALGVYRWVEVAVLAAGLLVLAGGSASALRTLLDDSGPRFFDAKDAAASTVSASTVHVPASVVRGTTSPRVETAFSRYAEERAWIESALDAEPRLLLEAEIRAAYEQLLAREAEVSGSTDGKRGRDEPWYRDRITRRLRSLRRFEATRDDVTSLARRIQRRLGDSGRTRAP